MSGKGRVVLLIIIMVSVAAGVGGATMFILYKTSFEQHSERLVETAQSRARLVEAIARHEKRYGHLIKEFDGHRDFLVATLGQLRKANENFKGFGETGEFTLAKREGDNIVFLLRHRHHDVENPPPVPFSSRLAKPMRRALSGESGTIIGTDYRGKLVVAAYEPVAELGWGIVAKIDLHEMREPFIKAGFLAGLAGITLAILGTVLFLRIGNPMVQRIEESERKLSTLLANLPGMAYRCQNDKNWTMEFVSGGCLELTGYSPEAFLANREISYGETIHLDDRDNVWGQVQQALQDRNPFDVFYRIRTVEGEQKWVSERGRGVFSSGGELIALEGFISDITERIEAEEALRNMSKEFQNHIKELDCLFRIADLVQKSGSSLENIMQGTVEIIASSFQFSDIACARITLKGKEFRTSNFKETEWRLEKEIVMQGDRAGVLEICYLEERPEIDEGSFLKTERQLTNSVAERLGRIVERIWAEEALEERHRQVISIFDSMDEVVYVADPETYELLYMNSPAKKQWGDRIGQKCYYALQNLNSPCPFCTNDRIFGKNIGTPYIWEFQNEVNHRWYHCVDRAINWPDGRMVRFETAIDITDRKHAEEQVKSLSLKVLEAHELERKLVAQEIHDSIGASLAAIKYGLEKKLDAMGEMSYSGKTSLEQIIVTVQDTIEESRRISTNLRPSLLDDLGLLPTIRWFCREFQNLYSDIRIESQIDIQENQIPEPLKTVIFRILQEALNNIAKHSGADLVHLSLGCANEKIVLNIDDNGKGFDVEGVESSKSSARGLGLYSMNDRAGLSGGLFQIQSTTGTGTSIMASWPID